MRRRHLPRGIYVALGLLTMCAVFAATAHEERTGMPVERVTAGIVHALTARKPRTWDDDRIVPLALDVTDPASIAAAAAAAADATVVINNAGIGARSSLLGTPLEEVRAVYEANVFGPIAVAQAFAPVLEENGGGALIDVHSALSWLATPGAYSSAKAALWSVTNTLRNFGSQVISRSCRSSAILSTSSMGNATSTPCPDLSSLAPTRPRAGAGAQPPCKCTTTVGPASSLTMPKRQGMRSLKYKSWL